MHLLWPSAQLNTGSCGLSSSVWALGVTGTDRAFSPKHPLDASPKQIQLGGPWFRWLQHIWGAYTNPLGFPGDLAGKESTCNAGDLGLIPGLGRCPGEGNGNPLLYSGLENPMYKVHGVTRSRTRLRDFHFHFRNPPLSHQSRSLGCYKIRKWLASYCIPYVISWLFSQLISRLYFAIYLLTLNDTGPRERPKEPSGWELRELMGNYGELTCISPPYGVPFFCLNF